MENSSGNEAGLLRDIALGNEEAFAALFHQYKGKIYAIAFRMTESQSMAEDILQDIFLRLWLRRNSLTEITQLRAYLYTATRNHVYNALRKLAVEDQRQSGAGWETDLGLSDLLPDTHITEKEYQRFFQQAIDELPERQQLVFKLIKQDGYKREEVAAMLQVSPETVKYQLAQAKRSVKAFLVARFLDDSALLVLALLAGIQAH